VEIRLFRILNVALCMLTMKCQKNEEVPALEIYLSEIASGLAPSKSIAPAALRLAAFNMKYMDSRIGPYMSMSLIFARHRVAKTVPVVRLLNAPTASLRVTLIAKLMSELETQISHGVLEMRVCAKSYLTAVEIRVVTEMETRC
jgi:hypothetical protein